MMRQRSGRLHGADGNAELCSRLRERDHSLRALRPTSPRSRNQSSVAPVDSREGSSRSEKVVGAQACAQGRKNQLQARDCRDRLHGSRHLRRRRAAAGGQRCWRVCQAACDRPWGRARVAGSRFVLMDRRRIQRASSTIVGPNPCRYIRHDGAAIQLKPLILLALPRGIEPLFSP
jgi:hypothetical protein